MTRHACRRDLPEPKVFEDFTYWDSERNAIDAELCRQRAKFGMQSLNLFDWQSILAEEFGEVAKAINDHEFGTGDSGLPHVYEECIQVAAVAVHMAAVIREASCE